MISRLEDSSGFGSDITDETNFLQLMVFLTGCYLLQEKQPSPESAYPAGTASARQAGTGIQVRDALSFINQNIDAPLRLDALSREFYFSTSYLCRIFKEKTGTTINQYITAKRITLAKSLLTGGLNVIDTCTQCGFSDYSNFIRTFTKAVGISPKKYGKLSV